MFILRCLATGNMSDSEVISYTAAHPRDQFETKAPVTGSPFYPCMRSGDLSRLLGTYCGGSQPPWYIRMLYKLYAVFYLETCP
jgi:hypothetical protein